VSPEGPAGWPPRFPLIEEPSPLVRLPRLSTALGERVEIWAKREDLLPSAFGGNKLRNLEYLVADALAVGADTLVTSGRRWSNHARLTAAAGARAGLGVHLVLTGPPEAATRSPNVALCERLGATVHVARSASREDRAALVDRVMSDLGAAGRVPYRIDVGGSGPLGALGQVRAALELARQTAEHGLEIDSVVLPSATGGTQAGLLVGLRIAGLPARVEGFTVAGTTTELETKVGELIQGLGRYLDANVDRSQISLDHDQLGGGYGIRSRQADEAAELIARSEGILVDPIYTAKALAGLVARVRSGAWDGQRVVFWHAGGLPALFEPLDPAAGS
jgi:D-cysteine desulfhydrase family pyridoxal phosphate-dependent enzyme